MKKIFFLTTILLTSPVCFGMQKKQVLAAEHNRTVKKLFLYCVDEKNGLSSVELIPVGWYEIPVAVGFAKQSAEQEHVSSMKKEFLFMTKYSMALVFIAALFYL